MESKPFLSVHETTNGEPECEELCRNDEKCIGFKFIRSKCFLKSSLGTELKLKMSISGKKFQPDYNGDPLKGIVEQNLNKLEAEFKIKARNLVYSIAKKSICVKSISKQSNAMSHHHVTMLKSGIHDFRGTLKTLDEESNTSSMKSLQSSNGNNHVGDLNLVTIFDVCAKMNREEHLIVVINSFRLKHRFNGSGQNDR